MRSDSLSQRASQPSTSSLKSARPAQTPVSLEAIAFAPRFLTAICPVNGRPSSDPIARFKSELEAGGISFLPTESMNDVVGVERIIYGGVSIGRALAMTPALAAARFGASAPFLSWKPSCPFVGAPVAYAIWDQFVPAATLSAGGAISVTARAVLSAAASFVYRLDTRQSVELVAQKTANLMDLSCRFGFVDGDLFLTRNESDYARDCTRRASEALLESGLSGDVEWVPTSHNPLRLAWKKESSFIREKFGLEHKRYPALFRTKKSNTRGAPVDISALDGRTLSLWGMDYSVLEDVAFWDVPQVMI